MTLLPVLRCRECRRVREGIYEPWTVPHEAYRHEVEGICSTCAAQLSRESEQRWERESRMLLRQRRRGFGPGKDDTVFKGFREGE